MTLRTVRVLIVFVTMAAVVGMTTRDAQAKAGLGLEVGGGVVDYTRGLNSGTDAGPAWNAQVNIMPTPIIGVELAYLGSHVNYDGSSGSGSIDQNGGTAALRLNVLPGRVQPFLFGGLGASRLSADPGVPVDSDTLLDVPAGAGLQVNVTDKFTITGRFRYNFQFDTDFSDALTDPTDANTDRRAFDRWAATLNIGTML